MRLNYLKSVMGAWDRQAEDRTIEISFIAVKNESLFVSIIPFLVVVCFTIYLAANCYSNLPSTVVI